MIPSREETKAEIFKELSEVTFLAMWCYFLLPLERLAVGDREVW